MFDFRPSHYGIDIVSHVLQTVLTTYWLLPGVRLTGQGRSSTPKLGRNLFSHVVDLHVAVGHIWREIIIIIRKKITIWVIPCQFNER